MVRRRRPTVVNRRAKPGLLGTAARTAVIAGTATAAAGVVSHAMNKGGAVTTRAATFLPKLSSRLKLNNCNPRWLVCRHLLCRRKGRLPPPAARTVSLS
jgi:hypothetical protein